MQLSPLPDIGSNRRLLLAAALVTAVVCLALIWHDGDLARTLGDTDDAMRLVMVRDLISGRGWYDQWIGRLQPPVGTFMHWSRLLDGALAALTGMFRLVMTPAAAETATRMVWPLALIYPAVACTLLIARRLGGSAAVFVCATLLAVDIKAYEQFRPGRIDHHNVQIVMTLAALACALATERRSRWALWAGAASAFGLAIGIEALAFHALIGASFALRAAFDRKEAAVARNYALSFAACALAFYAVQTPPWRWSMSFCDALAFNLLAGIEVGCLGVAALATWGRGLAPRAQVMVLGLIGLCAGGLFLALDPLCLKGPFGAVDPRLLPFWFSQVQELRSWPRMLRNEPDIALPSIVAALMTLAAAVFLLAREGRRARPETLLIAAAVAVAAWAAAHAYRMQDYVFWLGFPALAAALGLLARRFLRGLLIPTLAASLVLSPVCVGLAAVQADRLLPRPPRTGAPELSIDEHCFLAAAYRPLAALPPGLVLAEIDLGPFILAHTRDSVMAAPYHRMNWGILAAHDALGAPASDAKAKFSALKADYLVECPTNGLRVGPNSVEADVRRGRTPDWLRPLSKPGETLQIYRVVMTPESGS